MIDKFIDTPAAAVADIHDGATVLISGFGGAGMPTELIHALIDQGARDLTVVSNNAGNHETGLAALVKAGRVRKVICSFPKASHSWVFDALYREGRIELECVPQGTIAERLRAAGAGLGGFFTTTIVQVRAKAELGELPPEAVVTPGIFVKRVTEVPNAAFSS